MSASQVGDILGFLNTNVHTIADEVRRRHTFCRARIPLWQRAGRGDNAIVTVRSRLLQMGIDAGLYLLHMSLCGKFWGFHFLTTGIGAPGDRPATRPQAPCLLAGASRVGRTSPNRHWCDRRLG